jgi:hypothetical protein
LRKEWQGTEAHRSILSRHKSAFSRPSIACGVRDGETQAETRALWQVKPDVVVTSIIPATWEADLGESQSETGPDKALRKTS